MSSYSYFPRNCAVVSRASTALYSLFMEFLHPGDRVLFPANICYAAIFPALYARCVPVFCDVSRVTGNVTLASITAALEKGPSAAVLPHMYGQPIADFCSIVEVLRERNVLVIEDCASAMGAIMPDGVPVGFSGDFSVYSTGYAKTISLGYGGVLASESFDLSFFGRYEEELPVLTPEIESRENLFSKLYRCFRNSGDQGNKFSSDLFLGLSQAFRPVFLHSIDSEKKRAVENAVTKLEEVVENRRINFEKWSALFLENGLGPLAYIYDEGAVPWRFSFFVSDAERRKRLISRLLDRSLPVSDWYPQISTCFYDETEYPGALKMGQDILNFPILIEDRLKCECVQVVSESLR